MAALDGLKLHAQPGRKIEGWSMQVGSPFQIDKGKDPKFIITQGPPGYRVTLRFPETLAGYEIWLSGYNYDSRAREFACPDRYFEAIKPNDWVRVSGVVRPGSGMEWEPGKPDESLSLGEMTICDIRRVELVQK